MGVGGSWLPSMNAVQIASLLATLLRVSLGI